MKFIIINISLILLIAACSNKNDDPLIIPPNFAQMPDPNNPEKVTDDQKEIDVKKLKDLLLKTE